MNRFFIFIFALLTASSVWCGNLDNYSRVALRASQHRANRVNRAISDGVDYYPLLIEINSDAAVSMLEQVGAVIYYKRANFVLAAVPVDALDVLDNSEFIDVASVAKQTCCTTDVARTFANIDKAHVGDGMIAGYDGSGVVAGICDIGFDPEHIAFKNHLSLMSIYNETSALRTVYAPGSALQTQSDYPVTDSSEQLHGTHTANILAGRRDNNPYYGAAPGADLAVSASSLTEMGLLCGIEDIIAYATEQNKPAAINLSVGSYLGPHDGTDITNRYLDLVGKDAIICFAAGNNGASRFCLQHDFTADDSTVGAMIETVKWTGFDISGAIDFWSSDSREMQVQLVAYDLVDKTFIYESPWFGIDEEDKNSDDYDEYDYNMFVLDSDTGNEAWCAAFPDSYIAVACGKDRNNGRFNIAMYYELNPVEEQPGGHHWARYICGWRVKGEPGAHLDAYADGASSFIRAYGVQGMSDGNGINSISNLCCNDNTISVGSCNSRAVTPVLDGDDAVSNITVGTVSEFTSYGTTVDGRTFPLVCAPGNMLVSATSSAYLDANPDKIKVAYATTVDGQTYYWHAENGTSMAAPIATGIIALWLQAVPTLTVNQVKEVIAATSQTDFPDIADARWGAGCIDAYAGLKYLLDSERVTSVEAPAAVTVVGRRICSTAPISIFNMQGCQCRADADLSPGIYLVHTPTSTLKLRIK